MTLRSLFLDLALRGDQIGTFNQGVVGLLKPKLGIAAAGPSSRTDEEMKKGTIMSVSFALLLFAGAAASENLAAATNAAPTEAQVAPASYDNYTKAYLAAKRTKRPMLVILNPAKNSQVAMISLADVEKTRVRRDLLQNYVVAVIDTSTPHGKKVYELFGSPQLPRVTIIDSQQAFQVYQTSETLYGQMWDQILTTFVNAAPTTQMPAPNYCPYCQQFQH